MPLVDGFCTACRHDVRDHPRLRCPFCGERSTAGVKWDLEIGPDTPPEEVLRLATEQIGALRRRLGEMVALRREATLVLLRDVPRDKLETLVHHRLTTLERWAEPPTKRPRRPRPPVDPRPRKDRARLREAWKAHERRIQRQKQLLEQLPDPEPAAARLKSPLPPLEVQR